MAPELKKYQKCWQVEGNKKGQASQKKENKRGYIPTFE